MFGLIGVLHLLRGRRVTLGQLSTGLVIASWVLVGGHWLLNLVETAGALGDPDRGLVLVRTAQQSPWAVLAYVGDFIGFILGPVLLAVGLLTRRATPVWVPVALLLSVAVGFVPANSPPPGTYQWRTSSQAVTVVASALLSAALVGLALRILSLSDEAWARWQPLPDAPRRRRAPFPADTTPHAGPLLRHPRRRPARVAAGASRAPATTAPRSM